MSAEGKPERGSAENKPRVSIEYQEWIEPDTEEKRYVITILDRDNPNFLGRFSVKHERDADNIFDVIKNQSSSAPFTAHETYLKAVELAGPAMIPKTQYERTKSIATKINKSDKKPKAEEPNPETTSGKLRKLKEQIRGLLSLSATPVNPDFFKDIGPIEDKEKAEREKEIYINAKQALDPIRILYNEYRLFRPAIKATRVVDYLEDILEDVAEEHELQGHIDFTPENDETIQILKVLPLIQKLVDLRALDGIWIDQLLNRLERIIKDYEPRDSWLKRLLKRRRAGR